jgi:2-iminobutanoate/2-iminopropanoate deaminase
MRSSSKLVIALGLLLGFAFLLAAAPPAAEKKAVMGAAKPVGPYSRVVSEVGPWREIGLDPATGKMVEGGIDAQTTQVMKNAEAVLKNAGLGFKDVVRTTVFLTNIGDFQAMARSARPIFPKGDSRRADGGGLRPGSRSDRRIAIAARNTAIWLNLGSPDCRRE